MLPVFSSTAIPAEPARPIEALVQQLAATNLELRRDAAYELDQRAVEARSAIPALIKALDDKDKQVWSYAVTALAKLGPDAHEAIPALLDDLHSRSSRGSREREKLQVLWRSAFALSRIGNAAIKPLIGALKTDDPGLRHGAAKALGGMGPAAKEAVPALVANLGHSELEVRREVIEALVSIGPEARKPLIASLEAKESLQRASAILALGELRASEAAPAIATKFEKESHGEIRAAALSVLPKLGWSAEQLRTLIASAVKGDDPQVHHAAVNVLLTVKPVRQLTMPLLLGMLQDANAKFKQHAIAFLGALGPEAKEAAPALEALTKDGQPEELRKAAQAALLKLAPELRDWPKLTP